MNTKERNYLVDTLIGIAFLVAGLSALVFLIPINWIDFSTSTTPTFLWLDFGIWKALHKWGGIAMLVGVVVHQLLHWHWIVTMTKDVLQKLKLKKREQPKVSQVKTNESL